MNEWMNKYETHLGLEHTVRTTVAHVLQHLGRKAIGVDAAPGIDRRASQKEGGTNDHPHNCRFHRRFFFLQETSKKRVKND